MLPAMCCDLPESSLAPAPVAAMLAEYRRLQATSILDWGHEVGDIPGDEYKPFLDLIRLWTAVGKTGDWSGPSGVACRIHRRADCAWPGSIPTPWRWSPEHSRFS
jgi:hypothetical protein